MQPEDEKIDARDQRDGGWSWVQNDLYTFFLPIIGREATHLYQVLAFLIPERARNPVFELSLRVIGRNAVMGKTAVSTYLKVLQKVGMVIQRTGKTDDQPMLVLGDLRKLAKLGEKEIRRRLGVRVADSGDEGGGSDPPPEGGDGWPQDRPGSGDARPNGSAAQPEEATAPDGSGGEGVRVADSEGDLGQRDENQGKSQENATIVDLLLSAKQGVTVRETGGNCPRKGGLLSATRTPFNVLNLSIQKDLKTTTSPQAGKREFSPGGTEAKANGNGEGKNLPREKQLAFAAQRMMCSHDFGPDRYMEAEIVKAVGRWCERTGRTPDEAVEFEEKSFRAWLEVAGQMFHNWGWHWWFRQGYWAKPDQWPYDKQTRRELERQREASIGADDGQRGASNGWEPERLRGYIERTVTAIEAASCPANSFSSVSAQLREIAAAVDDEPDLERLDRELGELEEKLFAGLLASASEAELAQLREQSARELRPWQGRMQAAQIEQVKRQFLQKHLFEARGLPRLGLLYMPAARDDDSRAEAEGSP